MDGLGGAPDIPLRVAAVEVDQEGHIVAWSVAAESMFGVSPGAAIGRSVSTLFDPAEPARSLAVLRDASARAEYIDGAVCRREDGSAFHASVVATAMHRAGDAGERLAIIILDEQRDRERDRFIASVAHDLRQPIAVIDAALFMLDKLAKSGVGSDAVARIKRSASRLRDMTNELLDVGTARLGAELILHREHADLGAIVDDVWRSLQVTQPGRLLAVDAREPASGWWDRSRVTRIVENLLQNALVHSEAGTPISVSCHRTGGYIVLAVQNACPDPPARRLEELFEPFRRASDRGRAGLGLYIARELARAHGGDVSASLEPGTIVFTLCLPIVVPLDRDALASASSSASGAGDESDETPQFATPRRHRREPFDNELQIDLGDLVFHAPGHDISTRGLAFFSEVDLKLDERIRVGVSRDHASFFVLGTVRHVNPQGDRALVGIEFPLDLSEAELSLLKRRAS